jgi:hypothetical protein
MNLKTTSLTTTLLVIALAATVPLAHAQAPASESSKQMTAAHESFVKKDMNQAAAHIHQAAAAVKKESDKVAEGSKEGMKKAGEELDKLGDGVKNGTVKSEAELKKTFAKVDHQVAGCWHKTAAESEVSAEREHAAQVKAAEENALRRVHEKRNLAAASARGGNSGSRTGQQGSGLKDARRVLHEAEEQVAVLESAVESITRALEDPALYLKEGGVAEATRLGADLERNRAELERALDRWSQASDALDKLVKH